MKAYKINLYCFLLLPFPVSADEAEVWKCKIKETMQIMYMSLQSACVSITKQDRHGRGKN